MSGIGRKQGKNDAAEGYNKKRGKGSGEGKARKKFTLESGAFGSAAEKSMKRIRKEQLKLMILIIFTFASVRGAGGKRRAR